MGKLHKKINDAFASNLRKAMEDKFSIEVETNWNIFTDSYVTSRTDEEPLTHKEYDFIDAWSRGYAQAMNALLS